MYKIPEKGVTKDYRTPFNKRSIKNWLKTIDTSIYRRYTADTESYYAGTFSIWRKKDNVCVWFRETLPIFEYRHWEKTDDTRARVELTWLINGTDITSPSFASSMLKPIGSYLIRIRVNKPLGYKIVVASARDTTGAHQGETLFIVKGQTLVYETKVFGTPPQDTNVYIKEMQGTKEGPIEEKCPQTRGKPHDYTIWYSFEERAYQSCRKCNNLWIRRTKEGIWEKLNHPPWNVMRRIKSGNILLKFSLGLPGIDIFYDEYKDNYYFESFIAFGGTHPYMRMLTKDTNVPSYPATKEQLEKQNAN